MNSFADVSDFTSRHGDLDADEQPIIETLLADASNLIRDAIAASTAGWVTDDEPEDVPESVVEIAVAVAYRAWSNPDALARTEVGDTSAYYQSGTSADALWLSKAQRRRLRKAAGLSSSVRFRAMRLTSPYAPEDEEQEA